MTAAATGVIERLRAAAPAISVGLLAADLAALGAEAARIEQAGGKLLHFDVMDGQFCPMLTVGAPVVKAVATSLIKDVHLMVDEPLEKLAGFIDAGADILTVHLEASRHPHRLLQAMGALAPPGKGLVRGIALNPGTPIEAAAPLLAEAELVLLLAVNPGWGGQSFIAGTARRMARLKEMIAASGRDILTGVDGGVTKTNIAEVGKLGADIVVTGSALFDGKALDQNIREMSRALAPH